MSIFSFLHWAHGVHIFKSHILFFLAFRFPELGSFKNIGKKPSFKIFDDDNHDDDDVSLI